MKYSCDMVRDLLPLYYDNACSEQSGEIVREHLDECPSCRDVLARMQDSKYDDCLEEERESVIKNYKRGVKRKFALAGILASALTLIICFIVNIAAGRTLDWFFIVLTYLMVFGSVTIVPLIAEKKKFLWTFMSFTASLVMLLLTCSLYSGGGWFMVAFVPTIFGLSVVFLPIVLSQLRQGKFISENKGFISMLADTLLLYALIITCGFFGGSTSYWRPAILITTISVLFAWVLFVILRYFKVNGLIRSGLCVIVGSVFVGTINDMINWILYGTWHLSAGDADFLRWGTDTFINANIYLIIFITGCVTGLILLTAGIICGNRKKNSDIRS